MSRRPAIVLVSMAGLLLAGACTESTTDRRDSLPEVTPDVGAATLEALDGSALGTWTQDLTIQGAGAPELGCSAAPEFGMSEEVFATAFELPDEVLGELLLNADAAIRSLTQACADDDDDGIELEATDLARTVELIEARLDQLEAS